MKIESDEIKELIHDLEEILDHISKAESNHSQAILDTHPSLRKSARNLIHYRALRTRDITSLQTRLGALGLSRIARAEPHVMATLDSCIFILRRLLGENPEDRLGDTISISEAHYTQRRHSEYLLGTVPVNRRVRIMVTLPTDAAYDNGLVLNLLKSGMNTARINCAHDGPEVWKKMVDKINKAKEQSGKDCRISMDLAGPKIRTGPIVPGPRVRRFKPQKNEFGQVVDSSEILMVSQLTNGVRNELPVEEAWLKELKVGDKIKLEDTRNKKRTLQVKSASDQLVVATCEDTTYIGTGTRLTVTKTNQSTEVRELPALEQALFLKTGDTLRITKQQAPGEPAQLDSFGRVTEKAFVSCTSSEVFDCVKEGEKILFDDGKIAGRIKVVSPEYLDVEIVYAKSEGAKLKADKGINFPNSNLQISGLTKKDKEDLKFIIQHADIVNFSFVNSPEDVKELMTELEHLGAKDGLGVILKIETQKAYNNLTSILLEGMKSYPLGVMIARGDLAIECGWENMARIQQEILSLCYAAHIPDVWATQVLENLAKKGIPARSEITDAATALNAECVMLNKGPYILKAVGLLDYMLHHLNKYRDKNVKMSPVMEEASSPIQS